MRSNSNENESGKDNHFNEDDDNVIYLGSMNLENTSFSCNPETCYYIVLLSRSYLSTAHFHDAYIQFSKIDLA